MKGKYKAAIALVLVLVLLPLTLLLTLTHWVPTLAGIWLPVGTRISLQESPRLTRSALLIPDLRYLVGDCELARVTDTRLSRPSRWRLHDWPAGHQQRLSEQTAGQRAHAGIAAHPRRMAIDVALQLVND